MKHDDLWLPDYLGHILEAIGRSLRDTDLPLIDAHQHPESPRLQGLAG